MGSYDFMIFCITVTAVVAMALAYNKSSVIHKISDIFTAVKGAIKIRWGSKSRNKKSFTPSPSNKNSNTTSTKIVPNTKKNKHP